MTKQTKKTLTANDYPGEKFKLDGYPDSVALGAKSVHATFHGVEAAEIAVWKIGNEFQVMINGKVDRDIKTLGELYTALQKHNGTWKPHVSTITGTREQREADMAEARKKQEAEQFLSQIERNEFIQARLANILAKSQ